KRYHAMEVDRLRQMRRSMFRFWNVAWICAVLVSAGAAIGPPHKPSAGDIARAIRELGDDSFAVRERASRFLYGAGRAAEAALVTARTSADREVSSRADAILEQFKWGLYPDTGADLQKLIREYQKLVSSEPRSDADARTKVISKLRER